MRARPLVPDAASAVVAPAKRRASFAFGPRFFVFLALGLLFAVPAWIDSRVLWLLGAWNLLVAVVWTADLRRIPPRASLDVTRRWSGPLSLGEPAQVALGIRNQSAVPLWVDALDDVPAALRRELPQGTVVVRTGDAVDVTYDLLPVARGDHQLGPVWLRVRTPWAVAERWLSAPLGQTVRVYPDMVEARRQAMFLLRSRQVALERRRARVVALGRDFESLREYQPGDEPRDICWTATARRAKPVTRVYQPERSQALWILVDGGRLLRARAGERTKLDDMVNAALALTEVAMTAGDRVGVITYGRRVHRRLAPGRGREHQREILDALATIPAERSEADHAAAAATVMSAQKQRALMVWLTELAETAGIPDVVEHASRLAPRHVVLFAVSRQEEMAAIAAAGPADRDGMYRMLAVQETLDRRETLLKRLTQRGVLVLELPRAEQAATLIDRYLSVKERNLI